MISDEPPVCKGCNGVILTEPVVQALNHDWHPKCFRCSSCGQRLNNWYIQNDGNLYCRQDYWSRFGDKCNGCTHVITGPLMVAGEHKYHPECFQCSLCQTLIGDGDSYALVERSFLYCDHCYRIWRDKLNLPHASEPVPQTSSVTQTPRRKPHSIQMVEIPPTPVHQSQPHQKHPEQHQPNHHPNDRLQVQEPQQQQQKNTLPHRKLQLSLQVAAPDASTAGWRSSASYRHSFTLEGGRITPCVQISELDPSTELHGLAVGDKILEVNGTAVRDKTLDEIKTLLTNYKDRVHVMLERDLSPLRLPPEDDLYAPSSPVLNVPSRNTSSDDLNSTSASEGETVVVLNETVKLRPKGSLRARGHSPSRRRSKSPSPCPSSRQKSLDLNRSHSFSTRQQDHRAFRPTDLLIGEVLGQGFFGQALKATHRVTGEPMVLKELHNFDEDAQKSFLREVSMLRSLSHPCVLKFLGVLYREKKLNLVTEFIDGGTLSDLLLDHSVELPWKQRIAFAKDIAAGMSYLHSMNIIHRDLNSQNCLVRKDQSVVVADFGLAKIFKRDVPQLFTPTEKEGSSGGSSNSVGGRKKKRFSRRKRGTVVGNPYWMAPEMMTKGVYDEKVDVFSYGIIVCEIIARVTADPDYLPRSFDFGLNVEAFHQRFCSDVPEPYFMLAVLCSQIEPDQRPSFETIHVLCEALNLHVEHGMSAPADLQGSTVEFYRKCKEKMYGQNYVDVDSCTQGNTSINTDVVADSSKDDGSLSDAGQVTDSLVNGDADRCQSLNSTEDGTESKSQSSSDEAVNGISPAASNCVSESSEKSNSDGNVLVRTEDSVLHFDSSEQKVEEKPLSFEICKSGTLPSSKSSTMSTDDQNVSKLQSLRINLEEGLRHFSAATTNEDYAYFSCSSESPSVSMSSPCLSVEDFASCKSSPNSSANNIAHQYCDPDLQNMPSDTNFSTNNLITDRSNDKTQTEVTQFLQTSDQMPSSSAFTTASSQTGITCTSNRLSSSSVTNSTTAGFEHSNENGTTLSCSLTDFQAAQQLEYGRRVSPQPSSSHTFSLSLASSDDCDI